MHNILVVFWDIQAIFSHKKNTIYLKHLGLQSALSNNENTTNNNSSSCPNILLQLFHSFSSQNGHLIIENTKYIQVYITKNRNQYKKTINYLQSMNHQAIIDKTILIARSTRGPPWCSPWHPLCLGSLSNNLPWKLIKMKHMRRLLDTDVDNGQDLSVRLLLWQHLPCAIT